VRNSPLILVDPTGLCFASPDGSGVVPCNRDLAIQILDCAANGGSSCQVEGDDPDVCYPPDLIRTLAQAGIQQDVFWDNFATYVGDFWGWDFVYIVSNGGLTEEKMNLVPEYGWETVGETFFRVPAAFFRASLFDIANGTTTIADLSLGDVVGARPWWLVDLPAQLFGQRIEHDYGIRWFENGARLNGVLVDITEDWANMLELLGIPTDRPDLRWSDWQRDIVGLPPPSGPGDIFKWCAENPTLCFGGGFP
jgi:hypothetical protein